MVKPESGGSERCVRLLNFFRVCVCLLVCVFITAGPIIKRESVVYWYSIQ
jgi:hypothetical protein